MGVKKENQDSYNKKVWMILIIMIVLLLLLGISPTGTFKASFWIMQLLAILL